MTSEREPAMSRVLGHIRSNAIAYLALFVALGGTSYAAMRLPAGSVGTRQLKNHSVTPIKLDRGSIAGYVRDYAEINGQGQLVASRPQARLIGWVTTGPAPGGIIQFTHSIPALCFALVTTAGGPNATYATAQVTGVPGHTTGVTVSLAPPQSTGNSILPPVNVAVVCPGP